MNFLYPSFLWGLALIAIPIILHLIHIRRFKKVPFSNIAFLQNLIREKEKQNKVKKWLLLLIRILIIVSLVMAFAQPYLPQDEMPVNLNSRKIILYLDNSASMQNTSNQQSLFEKAVQSAMKLIEALNEDDQVMILSNSSAEDYSLFLSRDDAILKLSELEYSYTPVQLFTILDRIKEDFKNEKTIRKEVYLFTDFQNIGNLQNINKKLIDSTITYYFFPLQADEYSNIFIDTVITASPVNIPGQKTDLQIHLLRIGGEEKVKLPVAVIVNGAQKGLSEIELAADDSRWCHIPVVFDSAGWQKITVKINDYPITFDNQWYSSVLVKKELEVVEVYDKSPSIYLKAAFKSEPYFQFQSIAYDDNLSLSIKEGMVILNGLREVSPALTSELIQKMKEYPICLLIIPPVDSLSLSGVNNILSGLNTSGFTKPEYLNTSLEKPDFQKKFFTEILDKIPSQVQTPKVLRLYTRNAISPDEDVLWKSLNFPFITHGRFYKSHFYVLSTPLTEYWTDFARSPWFVPLLFRMAFTSEGSVPLSYSSCSGEMVDITVDLNNKDDVVKCQYNDETFIPRQKNLSGFVRLFIDCQFDKPGFYRCLVPENASPDMPVLAVNSSRKEGMVKDLDYKKLKDKLSGLGFKVVEGKNADVEKFLTMDEQKSPLWYYFIILALLLLLFEIGLLKRMR